MNDYHIRWNPTNRCYELLEWNQDSSKYSNGYCVRKWSREEFNNLCILLLSLKESN